MKSKAYIAIDLGAESGRAMVGVLQNDQLALHETHRFLHLPHRLPSGLHWDLLGLWGQIVQGVRKSVEWCAQQGIEAVSVGVDTWGVDYGLVGRSGQLLFLPFAYRDARHGPAYDQAIEQLGKSWLYSQTGLQFMNFNTLFQLYAQHRSEPASLTAAHRLLFVPDLFHYFFSGQAVVESTIASTSQMLDPRTGQWATSVFQKLGMPTSMLGPIIPPGTTIGPLLEHVSAAVGDGGSLKVIAPAAHDTASAVVAVPADPNTSWCYLSSGTWSLLGAELDSPCLSDAARDVPFTNEGGIGGTTRFLKNIAGLWLVQECRRHYETQGVVYDYGKLTELAAEAAPFRTLLNPDHAPFLAPGQMPVKIAEFARATGQPVPTEVGQFVRCCLESLALTYRYTLQKLESVLDRRFDVLHIVGGGGRNALLNQMTADAIGRTVVVGPYEATAAGNILVQAIGAGDVQDLRHIRRIITRSFEPVTCRPGDAAAWNGAYQRFLKLRG
jgi:rhamnulokinase